MTTHERWLDLLERQASLVDVFDEQIRKRQEAGMLVELSLATLEGEKRLYERMLDQAPREVLFEHAATSASARHS